ncbi:MAG TPA: AraC family ligand binding domain-containing protein, partial [Chitinophagaceae bacterium]|nr:AraC family ligand binding domain-containing protein [Chitinophagaceae bacterium]
MKEAPIIPMHKFQHSGLPFRVQSIKSQIEEKDDLNAPPHSHDHYEMIWVIRGTGYIRVDLNEYAIGDNHLYWVGPGVMHQLQTNVDAEG